MIRRQRAAKALSLALGMVMLAACSSTNAREAQGSEVPGSDIAPLATELVASVELPVALDQNPVTGTLVVGGKLGKVFMIDPDTGDTTTALDISERVSTGFEQGLLGVAVDPEGEYLYVSYTATDNSSVLLEYVLVGDAVDADSEREVLTLDQPDISHNGGHIFVGDDGLLWMAFGDGEAPNAIRKGTSELARTPANLYGTIIRIDPRPTADGRPYGIPADNPFAGGGEGRPEVWAWGLRNPWRFGIDWPTGDLWVADVGQDDWEELNLVPAATGRGADFGWALWEGTSPGRDALPDGNAVQGPDGTVIPLHVLSHADGYCSVTGGPVYRGERIPSLQGWLLFADMCDSRLQAVRAAGQGSVDLRDLGVDVPSTVAIVTDRQGELWLVSPMDGIFRVVPA
jgi:glucose/arabinose dehydrogenase